jgi:hypothetical protein
LLHQVGNLFELNVKLGCQNVKQFCTSPHSPTVTEFNELMFAHQHNLLTNCVDSTDLLLLYSTDWFSLATKHSRCDISPDDGSTILLRNIINKNAEP